MKRMLSRRRAEFVRLTLKRENCSIPQLAYPRLRRRKPEITNKIITPPVISHGHQEPDAESEMSGVGEDGGLRVGLVVGRGVGVSAGVGLSPGVDVLPGLGFGAPPGFSVGVRGSRGSVGGGN